MNQKLQINVIQLSIASKEGEEIAKVRWIPDRSKIIKSSRIKEIL